MAALKPMVGKIEAAFVLIVLVAPISVSAGQDLSDAEYARWRVATWRETYCDRDQHAENVVFSPSAWRDGDPAARGAMARDLICGASAYGLSRSEVIDLLGRPDAVRNPAWPWERFGDIVAYRILRARRFHESEPPVPAGYRRIDNAYDIRVEFDPATGKVAWFDVLPALEADS